MNTTDVPINKDEPTEVSGCEEIPKKIKKPITEKQKEVRIKNLQKALLKRKENKEFRIKEEELSKLEKEKEKVDKLKQMDKKKEILKKELEIPLPPKIDEVEIPVKTSKKTKKVKTPEESDDDDSSSSSEEEIIVRRKKNNKKKIAVYAEDDYVNLVQKSAQEKLKERLNNERVKLAMLSLFN